MRVFAGILLVSAAVWIGVGRADVALGAWGTVFATSVLMPRGWILKSTPWLGGAEALAAFYAATLISLWAADQTVATILAAAIGVGLVATSGVP